MKDENGEYNLFDLKIHITTTTEITEEQVVVKIINAIQDGNTWILISPLNQGEGFQRSVATK